MSFIVSLVSPYRTFRTQALKNPLLKQYSNRVKMRIWILYNVIHHIYGFSTSVTNNNVESRKVRNANHESLLFGKYKLINN